MNTFENDFYQGMVRYLRYRTDRGSPERWPGKSQNDIAVTRYPNILAELVAADGYPNIDLPAEFAGVSREIIAAVIEDNETLSSWEFYQLSRWGRGPVGYLSSPVLQLINPLTNKGKARRRFLSDLLEDTADIVRRFEKKYAESVLEDMKSGYVITYARWNYACRELKWTQYYEDQKTSRRCVRETRGDTA